jgi:hypothetical protein
MLVHHRNLGNKPALEDSAQKLFFAFEMSEQGDLVDIGFSGDLAGSRSPDAIPGEGFGSSIQEAFTRRIDGRSARPFVFQRRR